MPKMIPINHYHQHQESHLQRLQQVSAFSPYRNRRPVWIPFTVAFPIPTPIVSCQPPPPPQSNFTSADELNAANVLVSLSPKEYNPNPSPSFSNDKIMASSKSLELALGHVTDSSTDECSSSANSVADSSLESSSPRNEEAWYPGCISLSLPEDDDVLSPLHCFMRRYCVEAFTASPGDVATPRYGKSHGLKVVTGQVGIRCLYCKCRPVGNRPERAVCYPSSLKNIYHSIETWQRRHSLVCSEIPTWVRQSMVQLMESSKSRAGGRRQYWEDSAIRIGMVDTPNGVRFSRVPGIIEDHLIHDNGFRPQNVVEEEDREMVTDYLFLLMNQMETCQFTEEDRTGGRSKIKDNSVGFPGMQCKHCRGMAGFGRYFPTCVSALALANSDRNINNHIQKCRRCPPHIKNELVRLSRDQQGKNRRGLRKLLFRRVWERMHGPMEA
jgi:hypothetical protein